MTMVVSAFAV